VIGRFKSKIKLKLFLESAINFATAESKCPRRCPALKHVLPHSSLSSVSDGIKKYFIAKKG